MASWNKRLYSGALGALLVAAFSTSALGQAGGVGGGGLGPGAPSGAVGGETRSITQFGGRVLCRNCSLEEMQAKQAPADTTLYDLIRSGAGKGVIPCFAGDRDALLERAGSEIADLRHRQWIVMHNDDRHRREVRTVIERMAALFGAHAPLFSGARPMGTA